MQKFMRRFFSFSCLILILSILISEQAFAADRIQKTNSPIIVVIDPGHGGSENLGTTECGFQEKDMTLSTAKAMQEYLRKFEGIEVYLTRTGDEELSLSQRAKIAKQYKADFLISLHYNASETHKLYGSEVWVSLIPEYHAPGYQLATEFLKEFRDMGLPLRGIKTRRHSKGNDYYGLIRSAVSEGIPSIIVEHCHVDNAADNSYCDEPSELEAFGQADARAVAKYFGLKSIALGLDYSEEAHNLPAVQAGVLVPRATQDLTDPDYCKIELLEAEYKEDRVKIRISAADSDSNLIYYAYSLDGGQTFCDNVPWPEGDILTGEFEGTFETIIEIPDGTKPRLCVSATNPYDLRTISNVIEFEEMFEKPKPTEAPEEDSFVDATTNLLPKEEESEKGWADMTLLEKVTYILQIAIVVAAVCFLLSLIFYFLFAKKSKKWNSNKKS